MKDRRLGAAAGFLSAILLSADMGNYLPENQQTPCTVKGEVYSHQDALSLPYAIANRLPESKVFIIDFWERKIYAFQKQETGKRVFLRHKPALEIVFEDDNNIKFSRACFSTTPAA